MTKRFLSVVLAAVLCVSMSFVAFAATDRNYVVDEFDILSPSEIEELSAYADGVYEKCGVGMFFAYLRVDDLSKESTCSAGDLASIPGSGRSPGEGNGNPLQYSCLENPHGQTSLVGYNPWRCNSWTQLRD